MKAVWLSLLVAAIAPLSFCRADALSERETLVTITAQNCRAPIDQQISWFPEAMRTYIPYLEVCPVEIHGNIPVFYVLTADIARLEDESGRAAPKSVISFLTDAKGVRSGLLKYSLFQNGPISSTLMFWSWKKGRPEQIIPLIYDDAVSGDRLGAPMYWDPGQKEFREVKPQG